MGHAETDPSCTDVMMEQCKLHGFAPFHVKGDSPGFTCNRSVASRMTVNAGFAQLVTLTCTSVEQDMGRDQERVFARSI